MKAFIILSLTLLSLGEVVAKNPHEDGGSFPIDPENETKEIAEAIKKKQMPRVIKERQLNGLEIDKSTPVVNFHKVLLGNSSKSFIEVTIDNMVSLAAEHGLDINDYLTQDEIENLSDKDIKLVKEAYDDLKEDVGELGLPGKGILKAPREDN